jgi:hypothetical protein
MRRRNEGRNVLIVRDESVSARAEARRRRKNAKKDGERREGAFFLDCKNERAILNGIGVGVFCERY